MQLVCFTLAIGGVTLAKFLKESWSHEQYERKLPGRGRGNCVPAQCSPLLRCFVCGLRPDHDFL